MLACRRATELASAAMDRPLTRRERVSLRVHLVVCSSCRRATKQFRRMREAARELAEREALHGARPATLSDDVRARLRSRIDDD